MISYDGNISVKNWYSQSGPRDLMQNEHLKFYLTNLTTLYP